LTLIHAAGIQGIKEGLKPPAPVEADIFHISDAERKALAVEELNPSLEKALELFEKSALVRSVLPEHLLKKFIENKKIECKKFNKAVTDFEIKNYYPVL
jgi:glutamine synthetase